MSPCNHWAPSAQVTHCKPWIHVAPVDPVAHFAQVSHFAPVVQAIHCIPWLPVAPVGQAGHTHQLVDPRYPRQFQSDSHENQDNQAESIKYWL